MSGPSGRDAQPDSQPPAPPVTAPVDRVAALTKLADLLDRGALTDAEFAAQMDRLEGG